MRDKVWGIIMVIMVAIVLVLVAVAMFLPTTKKSADCEELRIKNTSKEYIPMPKQCEGEQNGRR